MRSENAVHIGKGWELTVTCQDVMCSDVRSRLSMLSIENVPYHSVHGWCMNGYVDLPV